MHENEPVKFNKHSHKIQALKGFKDVLPEHQKFWNFVAEKVKDTAEDYSFQKKYQDIALHRIIILLSFYGFPYLI